MSRESFFTRRVVASVEAASPFGRKYNIPVAGRIAFSPPQFPGAGGLPDQPRSWKLRTNAGKPATKDGFEEEHFMSQVSLTVNGRKVAGAVEDRTLLVHYLREHLGLTGTHVGCDTSQCGACVVHVDGKAVKSCTMLAAQASGSTVLTIEGLANGAELHPVQAAFRENHGLQCGFCTPGMIMAAVDMINRHPDGLDEKTVRAELEGNICRCTGYHNIVKSILAASMGKGKAQKAA